MSLTIDFETRSTVDLKKAGPWRYAEDASTEVICLAVKIEGGLPFIWRPGKFKNQAALVDLHTVIAKADKIEAHNMEFERAIWHHIMYHRYGFADLPLEKCYCSAAKAASYNIPRKLENACEVLNLPIKKDMAGHKLMLKMCKPRKPRKAEKLENPNWENEIYWHETPEMINDLCKYCLQDVEAEYALSQILTDLSDFERRVWLLDQKINTRGVYIDLEKVKKIVEVLERYDNARQLQMRKLTGDIGPRQVAKMREWLSARNVVVENLQKDTVTELLKKKDLVIEVRTVLELRQALAKSSVAKFTAMTKRVNSDGRIRSLFMYHGANTGRFTGKAVQPTNMPRDSYAGQDLLNVFKYFRTDNLEGLNTLYDEPMKCASRCVRGSLIAAPGNRLVCADYASIEARGNAWLAGDEDTLNVFRSGRDLYKVAASDVFGVDYEEVTKAQRQVGKVIVLSMGYAGGIGAFAAMAKGYNLDLETLPALILPGIGMEELKPAIVLAKRYLTINPEAMSFNAAIACDMIKRNWRNNNQAIVRSWDYYEKAAIKAIEHPLEIFSYLKISYFMDTDNLGNPYLNCELPSGRCLKYFDPKISYEDTPWGKKKKAFTYRGVDGMTKQWIKKVAFGGILCENLVQAMCRDLLVHAMLGVEKAGYPIILHVYDEIVSEVKKDFGSLKKFCEIMEDAPAWAVGMPIKAEGWEGKHYRK